METTETINKLLKVMNELEKHKQFKNLQDLDLLDLATKIIDLSIKDEIDHRLLDLYNMNECLENISENIFEINKTLIYNN